MQLISSSTDTADAAGEFTNGSGATGIESTIITADWLNTVQRELVAIITAAGLTPDASDDTQLLTALKALFAAKS